MWVRKSMWETSDFLGIETRLSRYRARQLIGDDFIDGSYLFRGTHAAHDFSEIKPRPSHVTAEGKFMDRQTLYGLDLMIRLDGKVIPASGDVRRWQQYVDRNKAQFVELIAYQVSCKLKGEQMTWDDAENIMRWAIDGSGAIIMAKHAELCRTYSAHKFGSFSTPSNWICSS